MSSIDSLMHQFNKARETQGSAIVLAQMSPSFFAQIKSTTALTVPKTTQIRVVGYARRSSKKEGTDSISRQRRTIEEYVTRKFDRPLDKFYSDTSITGQTWRRPGLQELMQDAAKGLVTHIIVEDVDRIARKLHIAAEFKDKCDGWNVSIHTTFKGGEIDGSDVAIRGFLSAVEIGKMKIRSKEGRIKRAASGGAACNMPYGYIRASGKPGDWIVDESKRKLIEEIYDAFIDGVDLCTLARILNAREILSSSGEACWKHASVRGLLANPKYMGLSIYGIKTHTLDTAKNRIVIADNPLENWTFAEVEQWAIVSKTKWHAAYDILLKENRKRKVKRPNFLLGNEQTGCANCGGRMGGQRVRQLDQWELRCLNAKCPEQKGHSIAMVENEVLKAVRSILNDPQYEAVFESKLIGVHARLSSEHTALRNAKEAKIMELHAELELLLDDALDLRGRKKKDLEGERDELHAFGADRISRRVKLREAELAIAEQEYAMMAPAPPDLDSGNRARLLAEVDYVIDQRNSGKPRADIQTEEFILAEAAIGNLIEKVIVGTVYPGKSARIEVVLRMNAIFGEIIKTVGDDRRSVVSVVHQSVPSWTDTACLKANACKAWTSGALAATDEQFAAIEPLLNQQMRRRLAGLSISLRQFVDLFFFTTRANVHPHFMGELFPVHGHKLVGLMRALWRGPDGLGSRILRTIKDRFPDLHSEMSGEAFLTHFEKSFAVRKKYRTRKKAERAR